MWQYFCAHAAYHGIRWFPQGNRWKMGTFLILIALLLPVPQLYVITLDRSSRHCEQPLLALAIASIVFSFFTIGFTILFCIMIPVPRVVKIAFHVFGVGCLIHGLMSIVYMFQAQEACYTSVYELFLLMQISAFFSLGSIIFLAIMFPFWVINRVKQNLVLDPYSRTGFCYEPVKCCTCLWHI